MLRRVQEHIVLLGLAICVGLGAVGQSSPRPNLPTLPADTLLGPGDEVVIHVVDLDEIPNTPLRVNPNGFVDVPLAGPIEAGGLTINQFKDALAGKLAKYITAPEISVNLTDAQSRPVSVLGAVNSPGVHQLQGPERLLEIISQAGGVRADAGTFVVVTREARWGALPLPAATVDSTKGFSTARLSLDSLLGAKDPSENILVRPDDVISVPKAELVYVVGDVKKAGGFQLSSRGNMSVLHALALAEGYGPSAAPKDAKIMRPQDAGATQMQEIPVNLQKIFAGKAPDVALLPNDVLFIPNSLAKSSARRVAELILQTASGVAIYDR